MTFYSFSPTLIPSVLSLFNEFKDSDGYKINWFKSVLLAINSAVENATCSLNIPTNKIMRYLGVDVYTTLSKTVNDTHIHKNAPKGKRQFPTMECPTRVIIIR